MKWLVDTLKARSMTPEEAAIGRCPDVSFAILQHRDNEFVGQTLLRAKALKTAVLLMQHSTAFSRHPERSISPDSEIADVVVRHGGSIEANIHDKANTVEPGKPTRCGDPQITIGRLGKSPDSIFGKAVLASPDSTDESRHLRQRLLRSPERATTACDQDGCLQESWRSCPGVAHTGF
jgi:hypothetical protein